MKEKYFKPDITDICVGYETEEIVFEFDVSHDKFFPDEMNKEERIKVWNDFYCSDEFKSVPFIITSAQSVIYSKFPNFSYRTPYLTKEQIEKEGWKYVEGVKTQIFKTFVGEYIEDDDCTGVEYRMYYTASTHRISVEALTISYGKAQYNCYEGNCNLIFRGKIKCINEFRNILKYLCINT